MVHIMVMRSTFSFRLRCRVKFSILVILSLQSDKVNASAAEEDLESTKLRLGGRRTVKRCMRSTTFVGQTSHQFLAMLDADQRELCHHLPKLSKWEGGIEGGNAIHTLCIGNYDDFEANTFSFWYFFPSFSLLPLFFFLKIIFSFLESFCSVQLISGYLPLHISCIVVYIESILAKESFCSMLCFPHPLFFFFFPSYLLASAVRFWWSPFVLYS